MVLLYLYITIHFLILYLRQKIKLVFTCPSNVFKSSVTAIFGKGVDVCKSNLTKLINSFFPSVYIKYSHNLCGICKLYDRMLHFKASYCISVKHSTRTHVSYRHLYCTGTVHVQLLWILTL